MHNRSLFRATARLQSLLAEHGIRSAVIGGLAVAIWGDPRFTRDADLKLLLGRDEAQHLLDLIQGNFQPIVPDALRSLEATGILFITDEDGWRIDLLLSDTSYERLIVERGVEIQLEPDLSIVVCAPEDLVILKLISTRGRDYDDAAGIIRRQGNRLDDAYVLHWLQQLERALDDSTLVSTYKKLRKLH